MYQRVDFMKNSHLLAPYWENDEAPPFDPEIILKSNSCVDVSTVNGAGTWYPVIVRIGVVEPA